MSDNLTDEQHAVRIALGRCAGNALLEGATPERMASDAADRLAIVRGSARRMTEDVQRIAWMAEQAYRGIVASHFDRIHAPEETPQERLALAADQVIAAADALRARHMPGSIAHVLDAIEQLRSNRIAYGRDK
jgi:hypothetical protein